MSKEFTFRKEESVTSYATVLVGDDVNEDDARELAKKEGEWKEANRMQNGGIYYSAMVRIKEEGQVEFPEIAARQLAENEALAAAQAPTGVEGTPIEAPTTQDAQPEPAPEAAHEDVPVPATNDTDEIPF